MEKPCPLALWPYWRCNGQSHSQQHFAVRYSLYWQWLCGVDVCALPRCYGNTVSGFAGAPTQCAIACGRGGWFYRRRHRGRGPQFTCLPEAPQWLLLALLVPCSLAIGNVYRTAKWPDGATPLQVAVVVNLSVVPIFVALAIWHGGSFWPVLDHLGLTLAQWLAALLNVGLFFRLQKISGPTYLSQIGYVAAAISLAIGALYFGETYPWQVWLGAALIIGGIGASAWENLNRARP